MQTLRDPELYMPGEAVVAEIVRHIDEYNSLRPGMYQRCFYFAWVAMVLYGTVAIVLLVGVANIDEKGKLSGFAIMMAALGAYWLWRFVWKPMRDHQMALRHRLFPQIFGFIENVRYSHGYQPSFLEDLKRLKLVAFTSTENDDLVSGLHDGMGFELVETQLIQGSGKHKKTVFRGLVFRFSLANEFPGMLVAAKRGNWFQREFRDFWQSASTDQIASGNHALDEIYAFRTNNFAAAAPVLAGSLTSVLTWLGSKWHGGDALIAISYNDGYLMLPTKQDYFKLPELSQDVRYDWDVKPIVEEMVALLAVAHVARQIC